MSLIHISLLVLAASVIIPAWLLQSARKSLSAEELLLVERNNEPVWSAMLIVALPGGIAYWIIGRYPEYGAIVFVATMVVISIAMALMVRRMRARLLLAGVPKHFVSAFSRSQVLSQSVFLAGVSLLVYAAYRLAGHG